MRIMITGANRGLGYSIFKELIRRGEFNLTLISRSFTNQQKTLCENEKSIQLVSCDFKDIDSLNALHGTLNKLMNQNLVFINNAGVIEPIGLLGKLKFTEYYESMMVNFYAPFYILNSLASNNKVNVINISTGAVHHAIAGWSAYSATKCAARMLFNIYTTEGGTVKHVDPGVLDTTMQETIRLSTPDKFPAHTRFVKYKTNGILKNPNNVACEIVDLLYESCCSF